MPIVELDLKCDNHHRLLRGDPCPICERDIALGKLEAVDLARSDDARAFEKRLEDAYARNRAVAAERDSYASRLDSIRAKCEAGASVSIPASYPYGDGYREACAHILAMVVEIPVSNSAMKECPACRSNDVIRYDPPLYPKTFFRCRACSAEWEPTT